MVATELLVVALTAAAAVAVAGELAVGAAGARAAAARKRVLQGVKPLGDGPRASTTCS